MAVQGFSPNTVYAFAALACAAVGAISEARSNRIPNFISTSGIVAGLLLHLALGNWHSVAGAALAAVLAGGVFLPFYVAGAMDAGDVKLMAAVCCLAGPSAVAQVLAGAALAGGLAALFVVVFRCRTKHRPHSELNFHPSRALPLPCALAIAAGAACSVCNVFVR